MVVVQNKYENTLVGVLRTKITFVMHSSPLCYVILHTRVTNKALTQAILVLRKSNRALLQTKTDIFLSSIHPFQTDGSVGR